MAASPMTFEFTSSGWVYIAKHGRVVVSDPGHEVDARELIVRALVADRASKITEQNIADMASEERR
jgi:hypothetical protein